jgi:antibiotic biosynthesis monooxygenase (ABM) superfamily enzyme
MIYLTQLVYLNPGKEEAFDAFEAVALPLITQYRGELLLRIRPNADSIVSAGIDVPYEVHLVRFNTDADFNAYLQDPERQRVLHLKNEAVRSSLLVKGDHE